VGFDIDPAREVCQRLGVELVLQPIDWDAKELELSSGSIDCIWNGMSDTEERRESMAMSMDYLNNKIVFLVQEPRPQGPRGLRRQEGGGAVRLLREELLEQSARLRRILRLTG
jgi:ABC-type amino acid transport substrate-binding protein